MQKLVLAALFLIGFFAGEAFVNASGCVIRQRVVYQQYAAPAVEYHAPVVAAVFAPIPVYVPQYAVGFADNGQTELQRLRAEIELQQLRNEFQQLKLQLQQQPLPQTEKLQAPKKLAVGEHPAIEILRKNCAACHGDNAKAKGGGLTLFDTTGIAKLTDKEALSIAREVFAGRMPKGSKGLSDADVGQVMSWLDTLK